MAPALGRTTWQSNAGYEGPVIFKANPGDTACPGQFYLWGDRYTNGGGYQAACHEDIEAQTWNAKAITMTNAGVARPRHGTVIPITLREWNHIRGIPNSDVPTSTELTVDSTIDQGEAATVTARVGAEDTFETGGQVTFRAGSWSETVYLEDGVAETTLPVDLMNGAYTVTAEYLGYDILEASDDSAAVEVLPALAASVTAEARCTGARGLLAVQVVDDAETAVDVQVTSPYGTKTFNNVKPGKAAVHPFTTRLATVPAGEVTVVVSAVVDGQSVSSTFPTSYSGKSCGS